MTQLLVAAHDQNMSNPSPDTARATAPAASQNASVLSEADLAVLRTEIEAAKTAPDFYRPRFTALAVERLLDTIDDLLAA